MDAADDLLHSKLTPQRMTPRKTTYLALTGDPRGRGRDSQQLIPERLHEYPPLRSSPPSPDAITSRMRQQIQDENRENVQYDGNNDGDFSDPASRIWAKIRRYSGVSVSHHRRNVSTSTTASAAASVNLPFSVTCDAGNGALRRRKHRINEGGSITQSQRLAAVGSKQSLTDRTNLSMTGVSDVIDSSKLRSRNGSGKGRRSSGKWGFGNWWLNV